MPRAGRVNTGGVCCHVLNRGNARAPVFHQPGDYAGFTALLGLANQQVDMRVLACCLMPNHFHLVVWPRADGDLTRWMQWLTTAHVRRYHRRHGTTGHVWQGRFKLFPIQGREPTFAESAAGVVQAADPLLSIIRYVERNPLRAGLAGRAEEWPWSSLRWWAAKGEAPGWFDRSLADRPADWLDQVNRAQTEAELAAIRHSIVRGRPYGDDTWAKQVAAKLGLDSTLRPRGRPRKHRP